MEEQSKLWEVVPPKEPKAPKPYEPVQKKVWDNFKEIGQIQKTEKTKLVVSAAVRDGVKYVVVREFYLRKRDDVWMPAMDGIVVPVEIPVLKGTIRISPINGFVNVIQKTVEHLSTMELSDDAHAVYYTPKEKK